MCAQFLTISFLTRFQPFLFTFLTSYHCHLSSPHLWGVSPWLLGLVSKCIHTCTYILFIYLFSGLVWSVRVYYMTQVSLQKRSNSNLLLFFGVDWKFVQSGFNFNWIGLIGSPQPHPALDLPVNRIFRLLVHKQTNKNSGKADGTIRICRLFSLDLSCFFAPSRRFLRRGQRRLVATVLLNRFRVPACSQKKKKTANEADLIIRHSSFCIHWISLNCPPQVSARTFSPLAFKSPVDCEENTAHSCWQRFRLGLQVDFGGAGGGAKELFPSRAGALHHRCESIMEREAFVWSLWLRMSHYAGL